MVFLKKKAHPRIRLRHPDSEGALGHEVSLALSLSGSSSFISKPALKFPGTIPLHTIVRFFLRLILSYDPSIYSWPPKIALRAKNVVADSHSGSHRICALALQSPTPECRLTGIRLVNQSHSWRLVKFEPHTQLLYLISEAFRHREPDRSSRSAPLQHRIRAFSHLLVQDRVDSPLRTRIYARLPIAINWVCL